jgi:hypothetical protein
VNFQVTVNRPGHSDQIYNGTRDTNSTQLDGDCLSNSPTHVATFSYP